MTTHDPTQLNRQGADVGTQYRSAIFYHNNQQEKLAHLVIKELATHFNNKIVTEISSLATFYEAEKEHQAYSKNNQNSGYCTFVINPKLQKLRAMHADKLID